MKVHVVEPTGRYIRGYGQLDYGAVLDVDDEFARDLASRKGFSLENPVKPPPAPKPKKKEQEGLDNA
jgi:hypothetical protein